MSNTPLPADQRVIKFLTDNPGEHTTSGVARGAQVHMNTLLSLMRGRLAGKVNKRRVGTYAMLSLKQSDSFPAEVVNKLSAWNFATDSKECTQLETESEPRPKVRVGINYSYVFGDNSKLVVDIEGASEIDRVVPLIGNSTEECWIVKRAGKGHSVSGLGTVCGSLFIDRQVKSVAQFIEAYQQNERAR